MRVYVLVVKGCVRVCGVGIFGVDTLPPFPGLGSTRKRDMEYCQHQFNTAGIATNVSIL